MLRYALTRAAHGLVVLWGAFTAAFLLLYALPGDAAGALTHGAEGANLRQELAEKRELLGLDRPLRVQYFDALWGALRGDFGTSLIKRKPASDIYFEVFGQTLLLALTALVLAVIIGVAVSLFIELLDWGWARETLLSIPSVLVSVPPFVVGLLLLQLFSFELRLIPTTGNDSLLGLVVAALAIAVPGAGNVAQLLSTSLRTTLSAPFVQTLRNWGMPRHQIVLRHALRNASLPVITSLGTTIGMMMGGTVLTETVFSRRGVGRVITEAVDGRDMPIVLVCVVVSAAVFVTVNFVVDLVYPLIDRRIRVGGAA